MKAAIILFGVVMVLACLESPYIRYTETKNLMDTTVTVTVYEQDPQLAKQHVRQVFTQIQGLEGVFSAYDNKSQLYLLNQKGYIKNPDPQLVYVINQSIYYSTISEGAFDVSVQPILELYQHTYTDLKRPPTSQEVDETLMMVGYKDITLNESGIYLKPGMKLTLGGIAKGYIIDDAIHTLAEKGVKHALVDAGGDIKVIGSKPDHPWTIALQNPKDKTQYITIIQLDDNAVATSGDYERYYLDKKAHHIVNPKTGYSSEGLISVTILADDATTADALATTVMVMGETHGTQLIENIDGVEALVINENKKITKTKGWTN